MCAILVKGKVTRMTQEEQIQKWMQELTLEEKSLLLTGGGALTTKGCERLGIPCLNMSDGPHGVRRLITNPVWRQEVHIDGGDVCYPTNSALGATWNTELAYKAGVAVAKDCKAEGIDVLLAPSVNMKRTPRCGRNFEYYAEDPVLAGMLGAAFINGVQDEGVGTSLKHYAANNQEIERGTINVEVDERTLREYYLKVFEIVLANSNPTSVMCAYNKLNGIWCSENKYLLNDLLKEECGYDGLMISDWGAVHDICKCLKAGLDLQMPRNREILAQLTDGLAKGKISMEDIDRAVRAVLKFIMDVKALPAHKESYNRQDQHQVAYECACEAITLLKNEDNILPITKRKYKKIAVIGKSAELPVFMGGGSSRVTLKEESVDTPLACIKNLAGADIQITYFPEFGHTQNVIDQNDRVCDLMNAASDADLTIFFVSDNNGLEVETEDMDRQNLMLPNYISYSIERTREVCENLVVVLQSGSAVIPFRWHNQTKGIVQMWYAGEAGGSAIADVLFGKVNPSGKLSETFMNRERTDLDYPGDGLKVCYKEGQSVGYRYYDLHPEEVWYPFGYGLSYTKFAYSDLAVDVKCEQLGKYTITAELTVENIGDVAGKEVVQLYVQPTESIVSRPYKELKKFTKVEMAPGEKKRIRFVLNNSDFVYYNTCLRKWHLESGGYNILIGASSQDIRLGKGVILENPDDYTINRVGKCMVL